MLIIIIAFLNCLESFSQTANNSNINMKSTFNNEIKSKTEEKLFSKKSFKELSLPYRISYFNDGNLLEITDNNSFNKLSDRQKAFLFLLSNKISQISLSLNELILEELKLNYPKQKDLSSSFWGHSIDIIDKEDSTEWILNYELDFDSGIVHVYMEGWNFNYTVMTH